MRRLLVILLSVLLIASMVIPVMGANYASNITIHAVVNSDQSCYVTVNATVHIEQSGSSMQFPIPPDATDVVLEGGKIKPQKTEQAQIVDLSGIIGNMSGDLTFTLSYTLPGVVGKDAAGQPQLQLPMLSGFKNSISQLDFTVTLPGEITQKAAFSSGYHNADIEKDLTFTNKGNSVVGGTLTELKDHETLTMYLAVEEKWFPDAPLTFLESGADDIAMLICGVLALIYWLIFLRFRPAKRRLTPSVPEGLTAGHIGAALTLGRADLNLMVFSWAQMGYLQIQSGKTRVLLHKKMDMGNERSAFERHCFQRLFKKQATVNATSITYAYHCAAVKRLRPNLSFLVKNNSGNTRLFRLLAALIGLFGGISFGVAMTQEVRVQGIWVFLAAVIGLICGWYIQAVMGELFLRKTNRTNLGIVCSAVWLLMGILAGQLLLAIIVMLALLAAGWMGFYGGLRTEYGSQEFSHILGLRQFLKTASPEDIRRIQATDPEYFHTLAPYAMALGVSQSFAKRFGKAHIPDCPYVSCKTDVTRTAKHWMQKMEQTLGNMERCNRRLPMYRFRKFFRSIRSN